MTQFRNLEGHAKSSSSTASCPANRKSTWGSQRPVTSITVRKEINGRMGSSWQFLESKVQCWNTEQIPVMLREFARSHTTLDIPPHQHYRLYSALSAPTGNLQRAVLDELIPETRNTSSGGGPTRTPSGPFSIRSTKMARSRALGLTPSIEAVPSGRQPEPYTHSTTRPMRKGTRRRRGTTAAPAAGRRHQTELLGLKIYDEDDIGALPARQFNDTGQKDVAEGRIAQRYGVRAMQTIAEAFTAAGNCRADQARQSGAARSNSGALPPGKCGRIGDFCAFREALCATAYWIERSAPHDVRLHPRRRGAGRTRQCLRQHAVRRQRTSSPGACLHIIMGHPRPRVIPPADGRDARCAEQPAPERRIPAWAQSAGHDPMYF